MAPLHGATLTVNESYLYKVLLSTITFTYPARNSRSVSPVFTLSEEWLFRLLKIWVLEKHNRRHGSVELVSCTWKERVKKWANTQYHEVAC